MSTSTPVLPPPSVQAPPVPVWRDAPVIFGLAAGLCLFLGYFLVIRLCLPEMQGCFMGLAPLLGIWAGWTGVLLGHLLWERPGRRGSHALAASAAFWLVWPLAGGLVHLFQALTEPGPVTPGGLLAQMWSGGTGYSLLGLAVLGQLWLGTLFSLAYARLLAGPMALGESLLLWGIGLIGVGLVDVVLPRIGPVPGGEAPWLWIGGAIVVGFLLTFVGAANLGQRRWLALLFIYLVHWVLVFLAGLGGEWIFLVVATMVDLSRYAASEAAGFAVLGLLFFGGMLTLVWLLAGLVDLLISGVAMLLGGLLGVALRG